MKSNKKNPAEILGVRVMTEKSLKTIKGGHKLPCTEIGPMY